MNHKPGIFQTIRMVFVLFYLAVLLPILTMITLLLIVLSFGKLRNFLLIWVGYIFGRSVLVLAGVTLNLRYHGTKPAQPAVYLFNHSSTLDLFIIVSLGLPSTRFIAKSEFKYNPFFWMLNKLLGNFMIDRKRSRSAAGQLRKATDYLREHRLSLAFAPEGTRSQTGEIGSFKSGAFHMAMELGYPIVPIFIEGAYDLCPGKSLVTRPGEVTIHFHPPIDTSGWDENELRSHINDVRKMYLKWAEPSGKT